MTMESTGGLNLLWSDDSHDIDQVVGQLEFPQLAKVAKEVYDSSKVRVFSRGAIVKLHGVKTFQKIELVAAARVTSNNERLVLPLGCSEKIHLLPFREKDHVYATVGDLISENPRPKTVVVNKKITLYEKNYVINVGEVLVISSVDKRCTNAGVVDFLICKHHEKMIGLPTSCAGNFSAVPDDCECTIKDLGKTCEFPQRIKFLANTLSLKQSSSDNESFCNTEYIAQGIVRRQYLICTEARRSGEDALGSDRLYLIPLAAGCPQGKPAVALQFPVTRDAMYRRAMDACCENLSMKHVVDCTPLVQRSYAADVFRRTFKEAYDMPLPLSAEHHVSGRPAAASGESYYATPGCHRQVEINQKSAYSTASQLGPRGPATEAWVHSPSLRRTASFGCRSGSNEEAMKAALSRKNGTAAANAVDLPKSVTFASGLPAAAIGKEVSVQGVSKKGRKLTASSVPGETVTISLGGKGDKTDAATRFLLSPSSSSDEEDGSCGLLSSSLATAFHAETAVVTASPSEAIYANAPMAAMVATKPVGKTKPIMKLPRGPPVTVKELWTPPCSPDYRDHTTASEDVAALACLKFINEEAPLDAAHRRSPLCSQFLRVPSKAALDTASKPLCKLMPSPGSDSITFSDKPRFASPDVARVRSGSHALTADVSASTMERPLSGRSREKLSAADETISILGRPSSALSIASSSSSGHGSYAGDYSIDTVGSCSTLVSSAGSSSGIRTLADVPDDLGELSVAALCTCLRLHELQALADKLSQQQVDGHVFMMMTEAMFRDKTFELSDFEVLKVRRFQSGWRPKLK